MLTSAQLAAQFNRATTNYMENKFPSGDMPVAVADFAALSASITAQVANISSMIAQSISGQEISGALTGLKQTLSGIGLAGNVAADIGRLADAISGGNQPEIDDSFGSLESGIAGALFAGGLAMLLGIPAVGYMSMGYMIGQLLFNPPAFMSPFIEPFQEAIGGLISPLLQFPADPLVLDLNGDGITLTSVATSNVYFDLNADGFAESTGWLAPTDGFLVMDRNGDGTISGIDDLFGNASVDGYIEIQSLDTNGDGRIDVSDAAYTELRIWQDLDQNGDVDAGELKTLADAGISAISTEYDVSGQNILGNLLGNVGTYTKSDGTTGMMASAWFSVNGRDAVPLDETGFTPDAAVLTLPQLPSAGTIHSSAYALTQNADLMAAWATLADNGGSMSPNELRTAFEALMLKWAGVDGVVAGTRGIYVNAQHLAFVEAFFGNHYWEKNAHGVVSVNPSQAVTGNAVENSFSSIMRILELSFLAQSPYSVLERTGALDLQSPYLFYSLLDFSGAVGPDGTPGNVAAVASLVASMKPEDEVEAIQYLAKAYAGLSHMASIAFGGDRNALIAAVSPTLQSQLNTAELAVIEAAIGGGPVIFGTSSADIWRGTAVSELIYGGRSGDDLDGGSGSDVYVYVRGDGNDTITEDWFNGSADTLVLSGVSSGDVTLVRSGNDLMIQVAESTSGGGDFGSITVKGTLDDNHDQGVEQFVFSDGTTWSIADIRAKLLIEAGTAGDDSIIGFNTSDVVAGGEGNDVLNGREGSDIYVYARGDGEDTIDEGTLYAGTADRLDMTGIDPSQVSLRRSGDDVYLDFAESSDGSGDGGSILLKYELTGSYERGVEFVDFGDGTVWTAADIRRMLISAAGTDNADTIIGTGVADVITGGKGDDVLDGREGDDTYVYARGDGHDTIDEGTLYAGTADRLVLTDIGPGDVSLRRSGDDLFLDIAESSAGAGDGGSILLKYVLVKAYDRGVEFVEFADGTVWTANDLRNMLISAAGTDGDDTIAGSNVADVIAGGKGNDALNGGAGNDTYIYARGDGNDTVSDGYWGGTSDRLLFTDIGPGEVTLQRSGNDVTFSIAESAAGAGDGGSVRLVSSLDDSYYNDGVEQVVFGEGTVWSRAEIRAMLLAQASTADADTIAGFNAPDTITAGKGDDVINGAGGDDTYVYARGDGNDTISDGYWGGTSDRLLFTNIGPGDVTLQRSGNDVIFSIAESAVGAGDGGSVRLVSSLDDSHYNDGVEQVVFGEGTVWSRAEIRAMLLAQASTAGADTIAGFNAPDTITAGRGDDVINGAGGNDTYVYVRGDGNDTITEDTWGGPSDRIVFSDLAPTEVALERTGNDLVIRIAESASGSGDGGSILIRNTLDDSMEKGVEAFVFAEGTTWSRAEVRMKLLAQASTAGNDTIVGFNVADTITAGKGDDVINGGIGNDTYVWARGDGNDTITEDKGNGSGDRVVLSGVASTDVSLVRNGNDLTIVVAESSAGAGDGGSILVKNTLMDNGGQGIETFVFADGTSWSRTDVLARAVSFVPITTGNDVYAWAHGDASEVIGGGGIGGVDQLTISGVDLAHLDFTRSGVSGIDLVVTDTVSGKTITVRDQFSGSGAGIEILVVGDTTLDATAIAERAWYRGGAGNDSFVGSDLDERFDGRAGDDVISAGAGNDVLHGGTGADTLSGEVGSDDYYWAPGYGSDVISDWWNEGDVDVLHLDGVDFARLDLARGGNNNADLLVTDTLTGETITVSGQFYGSGSGIESLVVGTTTLDTTAIAEQAWYRGGSGDDGFWGGDLSERFDGGAGDDLLFGGAGDDVLHGGTGADTLSGEVGSDGYFWAPGDGSDVISDLWNEGDVDVLHLDGVDFARLDLARGGGGNADLLVTDTLTGETITVTGQFYGSGSGIESLVVGDTMLDATAIAERAWYRGGASDDSFVGSDLDERFDGGAGDDVISAGAGNDVLHGGTGADTLSGEVGSDDYFWAPGDGSDVVSDWWNEGDVDVLHLDGVDFARLDLARGGNNNADLLVTDTLTGETITVYGQFYGSGSGIESLVVGTTTLDTTAIAEQAWYRGGSGDDGFWGGDLSERFDGGGGDDLLVGGAGDDVYRYASGDGNDAIEDSDGLADRLVFSDLTAADVRLLIVGDDLHVDVLGTGQTLTDVGHFTSVTRGLDQITFSDGTTWSRSDIASHAVAA